MFLYMSSHGVAGPDLSAYALFEDALANPYNRWSASLNVNLLATNLPVIGAGACWIFLDACQELVQDVLGQYDGVAGVILVKATAQEVANTRVRSLALAGSRFGHSAWGPDGPEPPYFTRALLRSFEACIDRDVAGEWVVTGERLLFHVPRVADAAFGDGQTEVEALSRFANHASFVKVANARVPVVIRTRNAADMAYLVSVTADDGVHVPIRSHPQQANCFLDVPPNGSAWQATPLFDGSCTYRPGKFFANPCAQVVYLEP
jgi:hypothetical protein